MITAEDRPVMLNQLLAPTRVIALSRVPPSWEILLEKQKPGKVVDVVWNLSRYVSVGTHLSDAHSNHKPCPTSRFFVWFQLQSINLSSVRGQSWSGSRCWGVEEWLSAQREVQVCTLETQEEILLLDLNVWTLWLAPTGLCRVAFWLLACSHAFLFHWPVREQLKKCFPVSASTIWWQVFQKLFTF